jgi:hypothetical protein
MLLLVFPITLYAANGFSKVLKNPETTHLLVGVKRLKLSPRTAKSLVLLSITSGFVFMTAPAFSGRGGVFGFPTTVTYIPSTMLCNAVPLEDVGSTVETLQWVNQTMTSDSALLAHDALFEWAKLSLGTRHAIVLFKYDISNAIALAAEHGYKRLWLVWWNTDIGWYDFKVPNSFVQVFSSGRISVFEYAGDRLW